MKEYRGHNQGGDTGTDHLVVVATDEADRIGYPLEHHVRHSPNGFSWGYGGSGPADLARSIMWDHLGAEPTPSCYQAFKFAHVARWPQDGDWTITAAAIDEWLEEWSATEMAGGGRGLATMAGYSAWLDGASITEAAAVDNRSRQ